MGGGDYCSFYHCNSSRYQLSIWKGQICVLHKEIKHEDCPCPNPYKLHKFPANEDDRKIWLARIYRKDYIPSSFSKVCSLHFTEGKPTLKHPHPELNFGHEYKKVLTSRKLPKRRSNENVTHQKKKRVAKEIIVTGGTDDERLRASLATVLTSIENHDTNGDHEKTQNTDSCLNMSGVSFLRDDEEHLQDFDNSSNEKTTDEAKSAGVDLRDENIKYDAACDHSYSAHSKSVVFVTKYVKMQVQASADFLNERSCKFYTGVSLSVFREICSCLCTKYEMRRRGPMSQNDTILLFFMRLRLGLLFEDLAIRFGVTQPTATRIFKFWLPRAAVAFKELVCWLPNEVIKATMPDSFKIDYPNTTCIIDGTELFIQRPLNLRARGQVYSNYKKHSTVKLLVAIAPSGYFMFVSQPFGGRASDKFTIYNSGFLDVLKPGMEVMADRGYKCHDELSAKGVKLNTPAFMKGLNQLPPTDVVRTRRIASVRIHVERAIARLKNFRILKNIFPIKSIDTIENIVICCAGLSNLQPPLIQRKFGSREKAPGFLIRRKK